MNEFPFQGAKEALDAGVVPASPFEPHAGGETVLLKVMLVARGCILTPTVCMGRAERGRE
jgi:hypothetical protein